MELLSASGFDPNGMASFFEKLGRRYGTSSQYVPALLQTHPLSSERVAESRARARQLPQVQNESSIAYGLAKTRLQVLNAQSPEAAMALYRGRMDSTDPTDRYGLALASMRIGLADNAERLFRELAAEFPNVIAFRIGQAEALLASGLTEAAFDAYREFVRLFPRNVPLTISYASALLDAGEAATAHRVLLDLLNNVPATPAQLRLIASAANAEGDVGNSHFYMSYYYTAIGDLQLALHQLRLALEAPGVHTVDRAQFETRRDQLIEYLPDELREREAARRPGQP